jgi:hypothetical protein
MGQRLRRALVRGRRADHWFYAEEHLVLRHPGGREATEVPVAHLPNDLRMAEHYDRLATKRWVSLEAIDELRAIAAGATR